jgi:hypothetical protein
MTESNLNLSQGSDDTQFSAQNIEQVLDILGAEVANLSDARSQETAQANVNQLRNLMLQAGVVPTVADSGDVSLSVSDDLRSFSKMQSVTPQIGGVATRAMDVASRVQNLGFVEFTAGLINGTFDAIIGATIKQMQAYAALVADLAKTLVQFQAENVSDAQINAHLSNRYPDGAGGTSIRTGYTFIATVADAVNGITAKTDRENMLAVVDALVLETKGLGAGKLTRVMLGFLELTSTGAEPSQTRALMLFTEAEVVLVRKAIGVTLASSMMDHLRVMAREGMARIVITEGSIRTKLTFSVVSNEEQKTQQAKFRSDSFNVGGSARARWGWGSAAIGSNYSKLNVNTVNEVSTASITVNTEMIGEVNLKFKTETFASFEAPVVTAIAPATA